VAQVGLPYSNILGFRVNNSFSRVHGMHRNAAQPYVTHYMRIIFSVFRTRYVDIGTPLILSKLTLLSVKKKELMVLSVVL